MEESGTKLHIPLVLKYFVLFPQKLSVCGRVVLSLCALGKIYIQCIKAVQTAFILCYIAQNKQRAVTLLIFY